MERDFTTTSERMPEIWDQKLWSSHARGRDNIQIHLDRALKFTVEADNQIGKKQADRHGR